MPSAAAAMPRKMLPPPITRASSRPSDRTSTSSCASVSIVCSSSPNSRPPIRASPESFRRTRVKAIRCGLSDRVPGVVDELDTAVREVLVDAPGELVGAVPGLLAEDGLAVEALVQLSLDDLL